MRIAFFVREIMPEGGVTLAAFRLAVALREAGEEAEVLYCAGDPPVGLEDRGVKVPASAEDPTVPVDLAAALARAKPDVIVVGSGLREDLTVASTVAPTLLHAHLHMGTCADTSRYWYRLQRPCTVEAGWKCAAIRPVLGCNGVKETLKPSRVAAQKQLLSLIRGSAVGVLCVSTDQAELYMRHGVPQSRVVALPNLGIRYSPSKLARAAAAVPAEWRSATTFVGRLSKTKGGQLLPELHRKLDESARLRVFGDGYLAPRLASLPREVLCGHVSQEMVAGILMWARSLVFPSLWPEPGGIVGVDAQIMGVPLAAFDLGAGRHWPTAKRFDRANVVAMAAWLNELEEIQAPRDPELVAAAQAAYWSRIGVAASHELSAFAGGTGFDHSLPAPSEQLIVGA